MTVQDIGRKGSLRRLCSYKANTFSRAIYKDKDIKTLHQVYGNVPCNESKEVQMELLLHCPCCKGKTHGSKGKGNLRHHHLYCRKMHIMNMRYVLNNILEGLIREIYDIATTMKADNCFFCGSANLLGDRYIVQKRWGQAAVAVTRVDLAIGPLEMPHPGRLITHLRVRERRVNKPSSDLFPACSN